MVNWPEMKRKAGSRVAEKLKSVSVQCRTAVTVWVKKFDKAFGPSGVGDRAA
jgi:hypothetical protein